ncbi:MAG: HD domain-containing phosphohydrolase [Thermodesulfobacteriota bacterium]
MDAKPTVLVVDDTPSNIRILNDLLRDDYLVRVATGGQAALDIALSGEPPDLVLLDIMMPDMDGYEVCRRLKDDARTREVPVLFVTAMTEEADEARGLDLGAVDYITKPYRAGLVKARVRNHLELKRHRDDLAGLVRERTAELALTQAVTIESLATLAETRDPETGGHIRRTQHYVRILAERLRRENPAAWDLDDATVELLFLSAPLHDVGKVGVPDSILLKPGRLEPDEFEHMKKHTAYGRDALTRAEARLGQNSFLRFGAEISYTHHEKWDGSGYPRGLAGAAIPASGRLMALADVYDALISRRVYKPPYPHSRAVEIIAQGRGSHFDPAVADAFAMEQESFRAAALEHADFAEEREALQG